MTETELQAAEQERADHSLFVQELVMSTLSDSTASILSLSQNAVAPNRNSENSEAYSSSRESPGGGGGAKLQPPPSSTSPAPSTGSSSSASSVAASSQQRPASGAVASKRTSARGTLRSNVKICFAKIRKMRELELLSCVPVTGCPHTFKNFVLNRMV